MQEGFRQTEGIVCEFKHTIYTPSELRGNLRCPAVIVNEHLTGKVDFGFVGAGVRWVAVGLNNQVLLVSLHMPHSRLSIQIFRETLEEVDACIRATAFKKIIIGMDANVHVGSVVDELTVGPNVFVRVDSSLDLERAQSLHAFLVEHGLSLSSTFTSPGFEQITRENWNGLGQSQIDFVAHSFSIAAVDVAVDSTLATSTDHFGVYAQLGIAYLPKINCAKGLPRNRGWLL